MTSVTNQQTGHLFPRFTPHVSTTQCTPDRDQDKLTILPSHTIFDLSDILPQMRGAQTCTPPPDLLPPSPTTAEPKRNDLRPGYHIARPPPYIITKSLYIVCIGPMMRSQHPPHTQTIVSRTVNLMMSSE